MKFIRNVQDVHKTTRSKIYTTTRYKMTRKEKAGYTNDISFIHVRMLMVHDTPMIYHTWKDAHGS